MRHLKSCMDVGLKARGRPIADEQINSKMDLELYLLASESPFRCSMCGCQTKKQDLTQINFSCALARKLRSKKKSKDSEFIEKPLEVVKPVPSLLIRFLEF